MSSWLSKIFGSNERALQKLQPILEQVNSLEGKIKRQPDKDFALASERFKKRLAQGTLLDEILPEAFALVREASRRTIGQRHYDVQILGGIALHQGKITEMKTGEGKTLVATLPLYLNALEGKGAHLVTVNDFLAKFQAQWMGQIFHFLGMSTGVITQQNRSFIYSPKPVEGADSALPRLAPCSRQTAYKADITYGTNNEFGFDYLRDNMVQSLELKVQRGLHYAIIDEIDSILIDEARTPLIISAPAEQATGMYTRFAQIAKRLRAQDVVVDEKERTVNLKDKSIQKVERWIGIKNLYNPENIALVHHLESAIKAQFLFHKDKDYVVKEGEIIIVDEFTGRLMHGRRYSEGLHQAIEAKEGVAIKQESMTMATISFQNLFRMYKKLSGMTGTATTEAEEFHKIYELEVIEIPTNKPNIRKDHRDKIYKSKAEKYKAVVKEVKARHAKGQPVLVGTVSIEDNEELSEHFSQAGIPHNVLNAKHHQQEAQIIAQAGRVGAVTVATNLAGRGIDIILGGVPPSQGKPDSEDKSKRKELASENEKAPKSSSKREKSLGMAVLARKHRTLSEFRKEHEQVVKLGGLAVVGTQRHESRRIDNQLRGRCARQGDPGESVFFVSLDDDLMRVFGGERVKKMMETLRLPPDIPIENKMVSRAIEQAQKRVEGHNFDIRKHLLEYDDVMNKHRTAIYNRREKILRGKGLLGERQVSLEEEVYSLMSPKEKQKVKEKFANLNKRTFASLLRAIYLQIIDKHWVDHLTAMEELRRGIGLQGYGQKDPLVEYKQAAYGMYQGMLASISNQLVETLLKMEVKSEVPHASPGAKVSTDQPLAQSSATASSGEQVRKGQDKTLASDSVNYAPTSEGISVSVRRRGEVIEETSSSPKTLQFGRKVGRNEPCPCGSGKKYKKCHGR